MEFHDAVKLITFVVVLINAWVIYNNRNTRDDLKELRRDLSEAKEVAAAAKAEAERAKEDIQVVKKDIHALSVTMLDAINKLDGRLHNFIVAQIQGVPEK